MAADGSSKSSPRVGLLVAAEEKVTGGDRLVKMEMEAAEALAGLAHWGTRAGENPRCDYSGRKWGSKGKRASQRVKTRSPPSPCCSKPRSSDLVENQATVEQMHLKNTRKDVMEKSAEAGPEIELMEPLSTSPANYGSCGGGRSRANLTEAEREARRLRRVLANRESARQTIRRRQAMCEVLTRKAADLAWENENLKREKEWVVSEYESLKNTNKCLKAQVGKAIKGEVEDDPGESKSASTFQVGNAIKEEVEEAPFVETSTSSSSGYPMLLYNQPSSSHFLWPSIIHSSHPVPSQPGLSQEQLNPLNINGSGIPLYILPPHWFFRVPQVKAEPQTPPLFLPNDKKDETPLNKHNKASSSSKIIALEEVPQLSLTSSIKTEASSLTETVATSDLQRGCILNMEAVISAEVALTAESSMGSSKKVVDAIAAAEARKRRKELTKLKSFHGRQWRMHY